jgi:hypothetical protein
MKNSHLSIKHIKERWNFTDSFSFYSIFFMSVFSICLLIHFAYSLVGWNNTIAGHHGFRQTQTAITTYYMIKDGLQINYITPVLGPPWAIPLEFPLYQWLVALVVLLFKTPLDQTGRFLSLLFFYLSIFPVYSILGYFVKNRSYRLIMLSFILLNPTYIFWSRGFLIESLALFFTISYIWASARALERNGIVYVIIAIITGGLAGSIKITTYGAHFPLILLFFLWFWFNKESSYRFFSKVTLKYVLCGLLIIFIPFALTTMWSCFADYHRSLNSIMGAGGPVYKSGQLKWVFGTLQQKISFNTWNTIFSRTNLITQIFGSKIAFGVVISTLLWINRNRRIEILLAFGLWLFGPFVFTNLYYVHDYYYYANNFLLSIMLGFLVISILENNVVKLKLVTCVIIIPALLFGLFWEYRTGYYHIQKQNADGFLDAVRLVKKYTGEDDVLLIHGVDWDPTMAYYSERKALMEMDSNNSLPLDNYNFKKALKEIERLKLKIAAMLVVGNKGDNFLKERIEYFNLSPDGILVGGYKVYLSRDISIDCQDAKPRIK